MEQWWRSCASKSGELQRARAGAVGPDSYAGGQGRRDEAQPGQCRGGGGSSAWSEASPASGAGLEAKARARAGFRVLIGAGKAQGGACFAREANAWPGVAEPPKLTEPGCTDLCC